jgi:ADP-ribose pyrophosphatase YjhB (NUDIX family)
MADTPKHSVSVAGIVVDDNGRVLVIRRRDNGHWEPPGGVLELDESFEEGVRREVEEETGIPVAVEHLTGVYKNIQRGVVALVFRCRPLGEKPRATAEARAACWVSPDEIVRLMDPAYAIRVRDALSDAPASARVHDGVRLIDAHGRA